MGGQDKKIVQFSSKIIAQWKLQQRRTSVLQQANGYRTGEQDRKCHKKLRPRLLLKKLGEDRWKNNA